jgi:hypothetical protein
MKLNIWVILLRLAPKESERRRLAEALKEGELVVV